jgi:hypothetical protein
LTKEVKKYTGGKTALSVQQMVLGKLAICMQKKKLDKLSSCTEINSKGIKDLNVRLETTAGKQRGNWKL